VSGATEAIRTVALKPLAFDPGEKSRYNQTEFLLLRMAIERISGKQFEAFMADTGAASANEQTTRIEVLPLGSQPRRGARE